MTHDVILEFTVDFSSVCVCVCLTLEFKDSLACAASGCSCLYPSGVYLRNSSTTSCTQRHTHTHKLRLTHTSLTLCPVFLIMYSNTHTHRHTQCPEAHGVSCNPASHPTGLITLLPACDPRERLSRVSWPLPLAGGHRDGSARPFITMTLGRETRGVRHVGGIE